MQNAPDFKIELFNAFSQPVIFLQDGKVAYANHAAAACGVDASMDRTQVVWEEDGSVKLRLGDLLAPAAFCHARGDGGPGAQPRRSKSQQELLSAAAADVRFDGDARRHGGKPLGAAGKDRASRFYAGAVYDGRVPLSDLQAHAYAVASG